MVIVDTTVWVDYLNGRRNDQTEWLLSQIGKESIGLLDLVLCEVLQGVRNESQFQELKEQLLEFEIFCPNSVELAIAAASNFRELRKRGFTVRKTIDCWIATFCLREGHSLLHRDREFEVFEKQLSLQVVKT
jgi:predicted nucleic acid-binding protein